MQPGIGRKLQGAVENLDRLARNWEPKSGWQIEELRVSLWAQQLGTPRPVSEQRIYKAIAPFAYRTDLASRVQPLLRQMVAAAVEARPQR